MRDTSTTPQPDPVPPRVQDFELLRRIGLGSYGEVWLARSITGALRAVKIVHQNRFDSARPYDREFQGIQKYEPVSRSAEGLVHVLHVSRAEDFFYYVMELADDSSNSGATSDPSSYRPLTLDSLLREKGRLSLAECLRVALPLTRGLEQLHASGLIHRDIKPSNIIFVQGMPKLADIGLVTDREEARTIVGTEGYLPPDGGGTPGADIYSLGKVLYEMSTGMDRHEFPVMPVNFGTLPDRAQILELSEIFEKACEALPSHRYQSIAEMRVELELLASGHSVVRRHRIGRLIRVASRAFAVLLVAAGLVALGVNWRQPQPPRPSISEVAQANSEWQAGLKALETTGNENLTNSLARFDQALKLDPNFLLPQAGRAEALALLAIAAPRGRDRNELALRARETAQAVLLRDTNVALPHFTLGLLSRDHDFSWLAAERHFRAGLAIDPNSARGRERLSTVLGAFGRADEAIEEARRAVELEPTSPAVNLNLAHQLHYARRYEQAVAQYRRTLSLAPNFPAAHESLSRLYLATDRAHEALLQRLNALPATTDGLTRREALDDLRLRFGVRGFWNDWLAKEASAPARALARAEARLQLGDTNMAISLLREAALNREPGMIYLAVDPLFDSLRNTPAFADLCTILQLPLSAAAASIRQAELALTEVDRAAGLTPEEKAAGFRAIFNGRTLDGWKADGAEWAVEDGMLSLKRSLVSRAGNRDPRAIDRKQGGHLRYVAQTVPDNFELRFEWKVEPGGDSAVNYRPGLVQYQVIDNSLVTTGRERYRWNAGALFGCIGQQRGDNARQVGEWNRATILCYGSTIEHHLNGFRQFGYNYRVAGLSNLVATLDQEELSRIGSSFGNVRARGGYLSLQDEGLPGACFRHLRWRRLE